MAFTKKNEEAVSPVIGVILMVAITVILAAVIAAFVFGMAGNIQKTKVVAATAQRPNATHVSITYNGGQDASSLNLIMWTVNGVSAGVSSGAVNDSGAMYNGAVNGAASPTYSTTPLPVPVGASARIPAGANAHIVGVGYFSDGSSQVIFDSTL